MLGDGGRPMWAQAAAMAGDPFAAMKDLDCRDGDARLDLLAEQLTSSAQAKASAARRGRAPSPRSG
jgi:hypothetical protein